MQQEDDLRGLAKVMDFMRALSILFVVINIYWFCYGAIKEWGINIPELYFRGVAVCGIGMDACGVMVDNQQV
ncbi:hypothetical protein FACS189416_7880 [Bacteroidia bacterium]|nr:hypothetical protein FACS189416_7880 [Bacteroidia bacterium]